MTSWRRALLKSWRSWLWGQNLSIFIVFHIFHGFFEHITRIHKMCFLFSTNCCWSMLIHVVSHFFSSFFTSRGTWIGEPIPTLAPPLGRQPETLDANYPTVLLLSGGRAMCQSHLQRLGFVAVTSRIAHVAVMLNHHSTYPNKIHIFEHVEFLSHQVTSSWMAWNTNWKPTTVRPRNSEEIGIKDGLYSSSSCSNTYRQHAHPRVNRKII